MINHNHPLRELNTFRVNVLAKYHTVLRSAKDLVRLNQTKELRDLPKFVLGGGSNVLFTKDFPGLILQSAIKGHRVTHQTNEYVELRVGASENWHDFVIWTTQNGWSGIENLAYIPGTVGSAPVQNLAAYGQAFEDVCHTVETIDLATGEPHLFTLRDCQFTYRSSIFKTSEQDRHLITHVQIRLSKQVRYDTHYHGRFQYESLQTWLEQIKPPPYTPSDIAQAIILQRKAKLPELSEFGTCGSFFVNPIVPVEKFRQLAQEIDQLQHYPVTKMDYGRTNWNDTLTDQFVKIPAGRLLDKLGWRGKWVGNVGVFDKHALVVVTNGQASGQEILDFTNQMKQSIHDAFDIDLVSEVRIL